MTICGKIDCQLPARGALGNGACGNYLFTALYKALKHFEAHGLCVEAARYNGTGSTAGVPGWPTEANRFKTHAWFLFRFPPTANRSWSWYLHGQWSNDSTLGESPNHPGNNASWWFENVALQVARGIGSTSTIWNGTEKADGTDTKGPAPYWKVPAGGSSVQVAPRPNGVGGQYARTMDNFVQILNTDADVNPHRVSIVSDGEAVAIMHLWGGAAWRIHYAGMLDTPADLPNGACGLFAGHGIPTGWLDAKGTINGMANGTGDGAILLDQSRQYAFDHASYTLNQGGLTPNSLYVPSRVSLYRVPMMGAESGAQGFAGRMRSIVREGHRAIYPTTTGDRLFAFFNNNDTAQPSYALAWDGVTDPGSTTTPDGVEFVR